MINQARSEYNKVIPKARGDAARIVEEAKGTTFSGVTTPDGTFLISGIMPGTYRLEVSKEGFQKAVVHVMDLRPGVQKRRGHCASLYRRC
jgi:hypothetical protein